MSSLKARKRARRVRVADLFCGAGSLSMGANDALTELGHKPHFVAVNHWDVATQTYARNHPGASVHCVTLDAAFPCELVPEGHLDLLMGGIECTFFSRARGGKPVSDQQRMSGWHVVRWCTELRVDALLLENVPEFVRWGPVNRRTGKPIKSREGEYFRAWWAALEAIGFKLEKREINCADYGDATTRVRLFILGRSDDKPIRWPEATHARRGRAPAGRAEWRGMRECIDWSVPGRSIFDRKIPLAPKTLARIAAGLVKFQWPEPFLVVLRQHCAARGLDLPMPTACAGGTHLGLVQPFVVKQHFRRDLMDTEAPLPAVTTVSRIGLVEPFVLSNHAGGAPRAAGEPCPGLVTKQGHALIAPYYGSGSGETCSSAGEPLPTATTKARFGLVLPVTHSDSSNRTRSVDDPAPTLTCARRGELAFVAASFGERPAQAPRTHSLDEPAPTICATGHTNLVEPGPQYDILFRMLAPAELAAAMSISTPERPYHFVGNKTQVVRQIGQAVPRRTGAALVRALMGAA